MRLSVVICTYHRADALEQTLDTLAKMTTDPNTYELIVVDNNSPDQTPQVASRFAERQPHLPVRYVKETAQGLSHARNRGIAEAQADWILFLDDDVDADSKLIEGYLDRLDRSEAAAFGGRILPRYEEKKPRWLSHFLLPLFAVQDLGTDSKPMPARKFPMGANMLISKAWLEKLGGFNPALGRRGEQLDAGEEKDVFARLRSQGGQIDYVGGALVHHRIPTSRTTWNYVKRQGLGTGRSERLRAKAKGTGAYLFSLAKEKVKWWATILLSLYYLASLRPAAAGMLWRFRAMVSKGLLFGR